MDTITSILAAIWTVLNERVVITALAGVMLWLLNKLVKPEWQAYEGAIIEAVKYAEKAIPNDTPNAGMRRFDNALRYVLGVYEQARGKKPSAKAKRELAEGISIVHASLEAGGNLYSPVENEVGEA